MEIRPIAETDVEQVIGLFRTVYGEDFPFQEFYDARWVKRGVFDEDMCWLVADDGGAVVGTAAVMLSVGDVDDLIGEFGRLVVHPDHRGGGLGAQLFQGLIDAAAPRIECGFAECRTVHPGAQKIAVREGFVPVGFEPMVYKLRTRESVAFVTRLFGHALRLRRNNPPVIPAVYALSCRALQNCGLEPDAVVSEDVEPYPYEGECTLEDLEGQAAYRLLRIAPGRIENREVFGGMRLEYGFLKVQTYNAHYLVAKEGDAPVGALGYVYDPIDEKARFFELIALDDRTKGSLLRRGVEVVEERHDPAYLQVDVAGHSPRIQQTLDELGFAPTAYCPAMVFERVERLDVIKMVKLRTPWQLGRLSLTPEVAPLHDLVERAFERKHRGREIMAVTRRVGLFQGLSDQEIARLHSICVPRRYGPGDIVIQETDHSRSLFAVMSGAVDILGGDPPEKLTTVEAGHVFGEMALLDALPRSASAVATVETELLMLRAEDFERLTHRAPALGLRVLRNLAQTLSSRLRATNIHLDAYKRCLLDPPAPTEGP